VDAATLGLEMERWSSYALMTIIAPRDKMAHMGTKGEGKSVDSGEYGGEASVLCVGSSSGSNVT